MKCSTTLGSRQDGCCWSSNSFILFSDSDSHQLSFSFSQRRRFLAFVVVTYPNSIFTHCIVIEQEYPGCDLPCYFQPHITAISVPLINQKSMDENGSYFGLKSLLLHISFVISFVRYITSRPPTEVAAHHCI